MGSTSGLRFSGHQGLGPPAPPAGEIRDAAKEILQRPEFREPPKSLYQRLQEKLAEWLGDVLGTVAGGGVPAFAAWLVLVAAVAGAAYMIFRGLQLDGRRGGRLSEDSVVVERRRPASDWDAEAAAFEARGEWRAALRCRYRALIARLARHGLVDEAAGRTAGELRAVMLKTAPAAAPAFSGATALFEQVWYGNAASGPDESSAFRVLADRVLEGVLR